MPAPVGFGCAVRVRGGATPGATHAFCLVALNELG